MPFGCLSCANVVANHGIAKEVSELLAAVALCSVPEEPLGLRLVLKPVRGEEVDELLCGLAPGLLDAEVLNVPNGHKLCGEVGKEDELGFDLPREGGQLTHVTADPFPCPLGLREACLRHQCVTVLLLLAEVAMEVTRELHQPWWLLGVSQCSSQVPV